MTKFDHKKWSFLITFKTKCHFWPILTKKNNTKNDQKRPLLCEFFPQFLPKIDLILIRSIFGKNCEKTHTAKAILIMLIKKSQWPVIHLKWWIFGQIWPKIP